MADVFEMDVDFSDAKVIDGTFEEIPEGVYPYIVDSEETNDNGNLSLTLKITDGDHKDVTRWKTIGTDFTKKGNRNALLTMLVSIGFPEAKLREVKKIKSSAFHGKKGHFYYKPKGEGEQYYTLNVLRPENVAEMQARFSGSELEATQPAATETVAAAPKAAPKANGTAKASTVQRPAAAAKPAADDDLDALLG